MIGDFEQRKFHAGIYWDGNGFKAVWAVRVEEREELSDSLMSLREDGARFHVRSEAKRLGFSAVWWEDGTIESVL